jgi:N-acyl amino acid synthase of PEP-CTERM/exosortase system
MRNAALAVGRIAAKSAAALTLLQHFDRYFEVVRADTPALRDEAYRIRHEVYCREHAFEASRADGLERDAHDARAIQVLLRHRPSGVFAGTVRLILSDLPSASVLRRQGVDLFALAPRAVTGEISRFAVRQAFRKRSTDTNYADAQAAPSTSHGTERRVAPVLTLGLLRAALSLMVERGIAHACALAAPELLRMLGSLGIELTPIGTPLEHRGTRVAAHADIHDVLRKLQRQRPEVFEIVTDRGRHLPAEWGAS